LTLEEEYDSDEEERRLQKRIICTVSLNGNPLTMLIDSGSECNYMSAKTAIRLEVPAYKKKKPYRLHHAEGQTFEYDEGWIKRRTDHLPIDFGNHITNVVCDIANIPKYDLVLGIPWLCKHEPDIEWSTGRIRWRNNECTPTRTDKTSEEESGRQKPKTFLSPSEITPQHHQKRERGSKQRTRRRIALLRKELMMLDKELQKIEKISGDPLAQVPEQYHRYRKLFEDRLEEGLPPHSEWDHEIVLKEGESPKFHKIYNLSEMELNTLKEWIETQLQKGYIRVSKSPVGYPVIFVPKKNGKLRLVIDYRELNRITIKDKTPLPLISQIKNRLHGKKWFTTLDLTGAYELTRMKEGDEWKTAFATRYGLYEYTVMPQGLTNAPASFQKRINHVLGKYLDDFAIAYIDDILIFSETLEEHEKHVHLILQKLEEAKLLVNPEKCVFHSQKVDFLGYVITPEEIHMDPKKVDAINEWPVPTTLKEVQAFLGLANYYRKFIKEFSQKAIPLTNLTKKEVPFKWEEEQQKAFEELKKAITSNPVLTMFDPEKPITIETDASGYAVGGVISQPGDDGKLRPIAFFSHKLNGPVLRYATYDREMYAILQAFKEWRHYCHGSKHKITVYTDHKNIAYFTTTRELSSRQVGYLEFLSQFDYQLVHCKGSENGRADALSRRADHVQEIPEYSAQAFRYNNEGNIEQVHLCAMFKVMENDPMLEEIKEHVKNWENEQYPENVTTDSGYPEQYNKVWVPEELRRKVVKYVHEHPLHGHKGLRKTYNQVQTYYAVDGLKAHVQHVVSHCNTCQQTKDGRHKLYGKLQPLPVSERPWESVTFDHITDLPLSKEPFTGIRYDSILVVVCRLTKQAYFLPHKKSHTSEDLAYTYMRMIAADHGLPKEIISDRGRTFASKFWQELMAKLGTNHKLSTAYHPQTDGQTERTNQIVEAYLRCYINFAQDDWVEKLPVAQLCYNGTPSESTGITPFYANYGFTPEAYRPPRDGPNAEKAKLQAELMIDLHKELQEQLEFIRERMKKYADQNRIEGPILQKGDMVYLLRHSRGHKLPNIKTNRPNDKLDVRKIGPYEICEQIGEVNYKLILPDTMKIRNPVFHISQLEKAQIDEETGRPILDEIIVEDQEDEYEIETVTAVRQNPDTNSIEYLVKWKGYSDLENSWEPVEHFNSQEPIKKFLRSVGLVGQNQTAPRSNQSRRRRQ
jgi:transposase InsO family protein